MKKVLSGNEAFARAAYEAGVGVVSSYPGTPSTEITECASKYKEFYTEWATNEKVAMEVAIGASLGGKRAMTCMKHVGLNVASDPIMTLSYTGVNAGLVAIVADDPNMYSSQNEQDSRHYARFGKMPMLEPCDSAEAKRFTKEGFAISEEFCTPVLVRSCTRVSHTQTVVELEDRVEAPKFAPENDIQKWVMIPANARRKHKIVENRQEQITELAESDKYNPYVIRDKSIGVVCAGVAYNYVREALPEASTLKLDMVWPLPMKKILAFSKLVDKLYVVEELDPFFETEIKAAGIKVEKLERSLCGELSADAVCALFEGREYEPETDTSLPFRPPNMCPGCSHRGMFYAINRLKLFVTGDIGCYTLGLLPPLKAINTTVCMGASIGMAHGLDKAADGMSQKSVAVIGDSTFLHTGINSLVNTVYNRGHSTVVILDNTITGMTGHQPNAGSGCDIHGEPVPKIDYVNLCKSIGVNPDNIRIVDPFDITKCMEVLKEETSKKAPSVIITNKPCIFADRSVIEESYFIHEDKCSGCTICTRLGCPAILWDAEKRVAHIDETLCTGCHLCIKVCKFGAIEQRSK
ncbi:indolepyruvate ferredoxin oxidoreductase, alpha subunit [Denitrovibrio acetiphilus DSM 12809]|uniref:Indolepyruvate oxidoreductase subunit IorA n=1 Tax=Denitrovibrio acetiphilus (strain DSM 12809 / NBRC 114555 / N2460) TaxID=522772 RepID=D4H7W3_DENA2|nr:indolepyruvate ferredoxin oxidoreductase subunit alpha [Denitrovibrio acetiphilus]ADD68112.1 indolepyruvate ferredoxin oxidoreductase, alpha subunit [Denitrovibrio acetiphilus DSM 12809]